MELDDDNRLGRLVLDRAVATGDFGAVYAQKECFFNAENKSLIHSNHFSVRSYANEHLHEPGKTSDHEPPHQSAQLSYLSVIRILEKPDQVLVISAVYSREGKLRSVYLNASEKGNWVHNNYLTGEDGVLNNRMLSLSPQALMRYGLPPFLNIALLHAGSADPLPLPQLPGKRDIISLHFNFNEWVQQHDFRESKHEIRYISYEVTDESRVLEPPCNMRFETQMAHGEDPAY
jgi:hypothetical protein